VVFPEISCGYGLVKCGQRLGLQKRHCAFDPRRWKEALTKTARHDTKMTLFQFHVATFPIATAMMLA